MINKLKLLVAYLREAYRAWENTIEQPDWKMTCYNDKQVNAWKPNIITIVVADERTKQEVLELSRYIHHLHIDTEYVIVSTIANIYQCPEMIQIGYSSCRHC